MITRIYQCPVIGSGTEDDPYRPSVADEGIGGWSCELKVDDSGVPIGADCIVTVPPEYHDAVTCLPGVTLIG